MDVRDARHRQRLGAAVPGLQRHQPPLDPHQHAAALHLEQAQLRQVQAQLQALDELREGQAAQLVLPGQARRRRRRSLDDVLAEDVGQDVDELLGLEARQGLFDLAGLAAQVRTHDQPRFLISSGEPRRARCSPHGQRGAGDQGGRQLGAQRVAADQRQLLDDGVAEHGVAQAALDEQRAREVGAHEARTLEVAVDQRRAGELRADQQAEQPGQQQPLLGPLRGYVKVFSGYGETLIDYNWRQTTFGVGVTLNDWL